MMLLHLSRDARAVPPPPPRCSYLLEPYHHARTGTTRWGAPRLAWHRTYRARPRRRARGARGVRGGYVAPADASVAHRRRRPAAAGACSSNVRGAPSASIYARTQRGAARVLLSLSLSAPKVLFSARTLPHCGGGGSGELSPPSVAWRLECRKGTTATRLSRQSFPSPHVEEAASSRCCCPPPITARRWTATTRRCQPVTCSSSRSSSTHAGRRSL